MNSVISTLEKKINELIIENKNLIRQTNLSKQIEIFVIDELDKYDYDIDYGTQNMIVDDIINNTFDFIVEEIESVPEIYEI